MTIERLPGISFHGRTRSGRTLHVEGETPATCKVFIDGCEVHVERIRRDAEGENRWQLVLLSRFTPAGSHEPRRAWRESVVQHDASGKWLLDGEVVTPPDPEPAPPSPLELRVMELEDTVRFLVTLLYREGHGDDVERALMGRIRRGFPLGLRLPSGQREASDA